MAQTIPPKPLDWLHFEGRRIEEVEQQFFTYPEVKGNEVKKALRTPEEAKAYAEHVILATQRYDLNYYAEPPFKVEDRGTTWFVIASGTRSSLFAPLHVELRKVDAKVVSYGMTLKDGRVAPDPPTNH